MNSNKDVEKIIESFLSESISDSDREWLETWLLEDAENRRRFYDQVTIHQQVGEMSRIQNPSRTVSRRKPVFATAALRIAAIVAVLLMGYGVIRLVSKEQPNPQTAEASSGQSTTDDSTREERYEQTMATLASIGSQNRAPNRVSPSQADSSEKLSYNRDIRPILSDRCFACHGPDSNTREAGLRLDTPEGAYAALEGDDGFHQIKPGDPDASEVFYRITTDDSNDMMPPEDANLPRMTKAEVAKIEQWIREGAPYETHWSFTEIQRPTVPKAIWPDQTGNPIDHFIHRKLSEKSWTPAPAADDLTLLRRISFDLTGLPPEKALIDKVQEEGADALPDIVDGFLDSVHHAEHLAVSWLDRARYADTTGYQYDTPRIMWRWRDWVIDAYKENKPYDQFLIDQIAGDLLPDATLEQKVATGYNRNHPITIEGGIIGEEYRVQYVSDRVNTIGSSLLGLTMECAKCHDHKYDSISQEDYFRMYAFFNNVPEGGNASGGRVGSPLGAIAEPYIMAPTVLQSEELEKLNGQVSELLNPLFSDQGGSKNTFEEWCRTMGKKEGWQKISISKAEATSGATFRDLGDQSWIVEGPVPRQQEVYTIRIPMSGEGWRSIKMDALTHESLGSNGPGRVGNGNVVLSTFEARAIQGQESKSISIPRFTASHSQSGYPVENLLKDPKVGWGIYLPKTKDQYLIAESEELFGFSGAWELEVKLTHSARWKDHSYGRLRFSASKSPEVTAAKNDIFDLVKKPDNKRTEADRENLALAFYADNDSDREKQLRDLIKSREKLNAQVPPVMVMEEMAVPRPTKVLDRGVYDNPVGPELKPNVPEALPSFSEDLPQNRLGFVQWMTDRKNPLTARVAVNQLWASFFGVGIVKTMEDFGSQGEWPSHPALLDWLAVEFIESGWDVQHLIKLITESYTYRQSSFAREGYEKEDPDNRLLARGPRLRLSAEQVRDQSLAVGGMLNRKVGGPGVNPYQPPGIWEELTLRPNFAMAYKVSEGKEIYRRSIYTFWKRAAPPALMAVFDAPSREVCTVTRESTNTPLQALAVLNGKTFVEASRALAQQLLEANPNWTDEQLVSEAFLRVVQRPVTAEETEILLQTLSDEKKKSAEPTAAALLKVGRYPESPDMDQTRLYGLTMVNRLLFNLSETVTRH